MTSFSQAVAEAAERRQRHPVAAAALEEEGAGARSPPTTTTTTTLPLSPAAPPPRRLRRHLWRRPLGRGASMLLRETPRLAEASSAVAAASAALTSRPSVVTTGMPGLGEPLPSGHVDTQQQRR